ncbi:hypothetical protein SUGI_0927220 [Cryptomeria japonica]|nr:hypothetical protein SUGI_0927220 [Cryptomeria japonica]
MMVERGGRSGFRKHKGFLYRGGTGHRWPLRKNFNNGWNNSYRNQRTQKNWTWKAPGILKGWNRSGDCRTNPPRMQKEGFFLGFSRYQLWSESGFQNSSREVLATKTLLGGNKGSREGKGLNITAWKPNVNPFEDSVENVLIWIKLLGLPQEYKDREILKQIRDHLGDFGMTEGYVDSSDFSLVSRLCIN